MKNDNFDVVDVQEELEKSLALLQATLESTADGIFVVDNKGKISGYNNKFATMWQIPLKVLESRDDNEAISYVLKQLKDPETFFAGLKDIYKDTNYTDSEDNKLDEIEFADGRIFERYTIPQRANQEIIGRVFSFRDVTQSKILNRDLENSKKILEDSNKLLEEEIKERKRLELKDVAHMKLVAEMEERKKLEVKNAQLQDQLLVAARRAGMTDIATSVLHNVGNVLNSVNVSITMIHEKINTSKIVKLSGVVKLLQEHENDIADFISTSQQGKIIPKYLSNLNDEWVKDSTYLTDECKALAEYIQHIKDIISKQNALSSALGINQEIDAVSLIEDSLTLNKIEYERAHITINRHYGSYEKLFADRVKILQVVVNIIKNGIEALSEAKVDSKEIDISIHDENKKDLVIQIQDNGIGIASENIKNIFSYGFTTKKNGHGFGMHTSFISLQEMGGLLSVESPGIGKGANFIIKIPYNYTKNRRV